MNSTVSAFDANRYRGKWVAFKAHTDQVIAEGATLEAAVSQAEEQGVEDAEYYCVPNSDAYFVGAG